MWLIKMCICIIMAPSRLINIRIKDYMDMKWDSFVHTIHISHFGFWDFCFWAVVCMCVCGCSHIVYYILLLALLLLLLPSISSNEKDYDVRKFITTMPTKLNKKKCKWKYHLRISDPRFESRKKWIETNQRTEMFVYCSVKIFHIFTQNK